MSNLRIYPKWKIQILPMKGVVFQDEDGFNGHLIPLESEEKFYELVIKPVTKSRSRQEEKYYHAVVCKMIAEAMSSTVQEAHEFLTKLFLTIVERKVINGKVIRIQRTRSTTELDDKQYDEYIFKDVVPWAALPTLEDGLNINSGLELFIPLPNEVEYDY